MTKPQIALVGQPNAGKSTLFNGLSDIKTQSSNFSGTTVEIIESTIAVAGHACTLVDLPGAYSLNPSDEAERVTLERLRSNPPDLIINVVDSTLLSRSLELTIELRELEIPMVIALNMQDEAERKGLRVEPEKLEKSLSTPVIPTAALLGKGIHRLMEVCGEALAGRLPAAPRLAYSAHMERHLEAITRQAGCRRHQAIKLLENPGQVEDTLRNRASTIIATTVTEIQHLHGQDPVEAIASERHHLAMKLAESTSRFIDRRTIPFRDTLDRFLLHPFFGNIFLLLFFFTFFAIIFAVGGLVNHLLEIPLSRIPGIYAGVKPHSRFLWLTVDGLFQGVSGALGIVLPYFFPLVLLTALFEDTGYLARIAFLLDGVLHRIGLHGKSVAPFIVGLGCSAPALVATRILDNRRDRLLSALLIPFIPCSARNAVIFALTAAFAGPLWAMIIYLFVILVIALSGKLLSLFLEKPLGLIMEIPDLKVPSLQVAFGKTRLKIRDFIQSVLPFLLLGSMTMSWLAGLKLEPLFNRLFAPLLTGLLGLPAVLGAPLVFGFFRKELIIVMAYQSLGASSLSQMPLNLGQVVVFAIFVTLYFPCLSTFIVMWREFGARVAWLSAGLSIGVATGAALLFKLFFLIVH
jgi:ferrous iron transport protein B